MVRSETNRTNMAHRSGARAASKRMARDDRGARVSEPHSERFVVAAGLGLAAARSVTAALHT